MNRFSKISIYAAVFGLGLYGLMAGRSYAFIDKGTYTYIHNEAEYSIDLPDAPVGETVWADQKDPIPFIENAPKFGSIGEIARVKRVDIDTGDTFEVEITFLKAERDFLLSMTQERMKEELNNVYKDMNLDNKQESFSAGSDTLKWATLTGFTVDENNNLLFNSAHYLTGLSSVMVVRSRYNVENKKFQGYYDTMSKSIKYAGLK
ncbi:MAG TPA: hypothetical protein VEF76_03250 [Patescibacteria group bacterium]|nr:hypothetical protein [Patescibacteria group bacterium]